MKRTIILFESVLLCFLILTIFSTKAAYAELYMSISGIVKDTDINKGVEGAEVVVVQKGISVSKYYSAITNREGNFIVKSVPSGTYDFYVYPTNDYVITDFPVEIAVKKGKNIVGLDINLKRAGSLTGMVYQRENNVPLQGALVFAYTPEDNVVFGFTDSNGRYTLPGLKSTSAGTVAVLPDGYAGIKNENVSIMPGQVTQITDIVVGSNTSNSIKGTVYAPDGSKIPSAQILFYNEQYIAKATTDASGNFSIAGLNPGIYTASVIAQKYGLLLQANISISNGLNIINLNYHSYSAIRFQIKSLIQTLLVSMVEIAPTGILGIAEANEQCPSPEVKCFNVFLGCMGDIILAPGASTFLQEGAQSYGYFKTASTWQYAANKGLTYPLRSSIVRGALKLGSKIPGAVQLAVIIVAEGICIKKEVECVNGQ